MEKESGEMARCCSSSLWSKIMGFFKGEEKRKKVLIIDDDRGLLKLVKANLQSRGIYVLTAATGEVGLEVARKQKPDLILLDVILPRMKGRQVCVKLKEDEKTKDIPVIFLTAKDSPDDVQAEMEAGGITHITKPLDTKMLLEEISKILGIL